MTSSIADDLQEFLDCGIQFNREQRHEICDSIKKWTLPSTEESLLAAQTYQLLKAYLQSSIIKQLLKKDQTYKDHITKKILAALQKPYEPIISDSLKKEKELLEEWRDGRGSRVRYGFDQRLCGGNTTEKSIVMKAIENYEKEIDDHNNLLKNQREQGLRSFQADVLKNWSKCLMKKPKSDFAAELHEAIASLKGTEQDRIKKLGSYSYTKFAEYWQGHNRDKETIKSNYLKRDFNLAKYDQRLKKILEKETALGTSEEKRLKNKYIKEVNENLSLVQMQEEIDAVEAWRNKIIADLEAHIEKVLDLMKKLNPIIKELLPLGRLWNLSEGFWRHTDLSEIEKYAVLLNENKGIKQLAEMLGRLRLAGIAVEKEKLEELFMRPENLLDPHGRSEIVGVQEGNNLNYALPGELALMNDPVTEDLFYKKYAEKKIQEMQLIDRTDTETQELRTITQEKELPLDKGPFLIAVDTSGSMHGTPELMAKMITLAIAKEAAKDLRAVTVISFSTGIETLSLDTRTMDLKALAQFLGHSFHGGTDIDPAVEYALDQMANDQYKNADLLLLTDGIFPSLSSRLLKKVEKLRKNKNRFHSMMICNSGRGRLDWCDNTWIVNGSGNSLLKLVRNLREMVK